MFVASNGLPLNMAGMALLSNDPIMLPASNAAGPQEAHEQQQAK